MEEIFTSHYFPDDPNIDAKRAVLEAAYILYIPKPLKLVHVVEGEEGKYQTKNDLSVSCPTDYQLISGGCKSEPNAEDSKLWIIASLKPTNNTFSCVVNMDYLTDPAGHRYYKGLDVSASCLHNDYIKEKIITSCISGAGSTASECIAQCPVDYDVTGGGCESNSVQESKPWKVVRSSPVYNTDAQWSGWSCRTAYNQDVQTDALCVKLNDLTQ